MNVIAVLNQKGGSGKTTISTHLARGLQLLKNKKVLLVDSDPQGSSRDWAAVNENNPVSVVGIDRPTIDRDLRSIANNQDYIIIDGAPQASDLAVSAIKAANIIFIPVQPSPYDVWATSDLVDLVKQRIELSENKVKAFFVVSRAIKGTKLGTEILETLEGYQLPIMKTIITQRVAYPNSAATGSSVLDDDINSEASKEIKALIEEVSSIH